jgi:aspartyl-tRNA(Asn)/glutamyl-tRNA(Gln) amidotransferase subunit A
VPTNLCAMNDTWHDMTALALGAAIAEGDIDPVDLTESYLDRINKEDADHTVFLAVTKDRARAEAAAAHKRAQDNLRLGPLDGVPISWKDLFDVAGTPTTAGSDVFRESVPEHDALTLTRATRAGMVCLGKTNLSEFAFSGLGINPTYGTPVNPYDAETPRCPGGSSSGSAVSVARKLAPITVGTDTGGSVRIPAAWNGLVGLKTTSGVVPTRGVLPLSRQFDTVGPLAQDVADANALFGILGGGKAADLVGSSVRGKRFLVPENCVWEGAEEGVIDCLEAAFEKLATKGAVIDRGQVPEFDAVTDLCNTVGNLFSPEAYGEWRDILENKSDRMYDEVTRRFKMAENMSSIDVAEAFHKLRKLRARYLKRIAAYDAVLMPTTPITPPAIAPLEADSTAYGAANISALYNTRLGNLLALSSLTLPAGLADGLPVGLMLFGLPRRENALLRNAAGIEKVLTA